MSEKPNNLVKIDETVQEKTVANAASRVFLGFQPPTSSTVYTPNQFFDVCLPYRSRGCVRLVGYMLRRTLGWSDAEGNPLEEQIVVSYGDLVNHAGISREMIRTAIDEAIKFGFLICVREGRPSGPRHNAISALYELAWDDSTEYVKNPDRFRGFFAGEGNRTYIPNQFFDDVLRHESLSVAKVVGAVIRFSIGFQNKHGFRRKHVQLSYNHIQRYAQIPSRTTLAGAIRTALENNYIVRIQEGLFTSDTAQQLTTTYSLKWLDNKHLYNIGQKNVPGNETHLPGTGQKNVPGKSGLDRSEKRTRPGQKNVPGDRSEKRTSVEITAKNNISKQQQVGYAAPAAANREIVSLLIKQGFSTHDAQKLSETYPEDQIRQQVEWLPQRNPGKNPTGLLRKAIELNFDQPPALECQRADIGHGRAFAAHFYAGLAGNQGDPVIQPSSKETVLAEGYVTRLLQVWQDESKIAEWGRDFGQHVAVEVNGKKGVIPSLTFALNASPFGEQFYKQLVSERVAKLRQLNQRRKEEHQRRYWKTYLAYLKTEHTRLAQENPERLQEFEDAHAAERDQIKGYRISEEFHRQMLQDHDSPKTRRAKFAEFFGYSFWKWDAEINEDSFKDTEHP